MATTTQTQTAGIAKKQPPDERFWKRYSPHHEFGLSSVGSLAIHVLIIGLLILIGYLIAWAGLNQPQKKVPLEAVTLSGGGGGGTANGVKDTKGKKNPKEAQPSERKSDDASREKPADVVAAASELNLDAIAKKASPKLMQDSDFKMYLKMPKLDQSKIATLADIANQTENDLMSAVAKNSGPPAGPKDSGPGRDGGKDGGRDGGEGTGVGPGKGGGTINQRQQRMLRWVMSFNTGGRLGYFEQLRGLGAVIAIPTERTAANPTGYKAIFWPAGVKKVDNIADLNRIYWKDYEPTSVRQVMKGSNHAGPPPNHFVALMPFELEEKLKEIEKNEADRRGHSVEDIFETKFQVTQSGSRFEPVLLEQTYK